MFHSQNLILNTDSYKASHYLQYPKGAEYVSSYIESRGGRYDQTLFFGLQYYLKAYLSKPITQADINEAEDVLLAHGLVFNRKGWQHILEAHHGIMPVRIQAVREGSIIAKRQVMLQMVNTDPQCFWLVNYLETSLLRAIWYPSTVATLSYHIKKIIRQFLEETADSSDGILFKLHDFGARGASSYESAALGGLAHLVNFLGTDTTSALVYAREYYHEPMAGFSIPAAEHSTITAWGKANELQAYENMLDQFLGEAKLVAVVSDSYNLWHALEHLWAEALKGKIIQSKGVVIIRPDSGNPIEVVCKTLTILMEKFGYEINSKGYKVLPPYLRVIQGDGISSDSIKAILQQMKAEGFSADNIAFGMGAELLQKVNRDTQRFAMKASAICIDGQWQDIYKDPITDHQKKSKRGRLALVKEAEVFQTVRLDNLNGRLNYLEPIFEDGHILTEQTLAEIREMC
ncbi:nicotinate phosphoribosyltransferase [Thiotrichales bacterium 19S3-7]|nr:nicotinate phosphoribosyltransferase [Thiotrichales bacterium 19S3-7]MCF6801575.1 nicotinate phosphoribosyltransferase [Thiotrichales bacterium 19S3-11]